MELKRVPTSAHPKRERTFNRTTMELKPDRQFWYKPSPKQLLIEPLWNWNRPSVRRATASLFLLIEPLWNWNISIQRQRPSSIPLLIEPLWNWNWSRKARPRSRTALLIEPLWNWNFAWLIHIRSFAPLLIEPLWNWNCARALNCPWRIFSFNRTTMELKPSERSKGSYGTSYF